MCSESDVIFCFHSSTNEIRFALFTSFSQKANNINNWNKAPHNLNIINVMSEYKIY